MRIILRLGLLGLFSLMASCSSPNRADSPPDGIEWVRHTEWSTETRLAEWSGTHGPTSLFVGFVRPQDRNIPPDQRTSLITKFQIQAGQPFTTLLILKSGYSEPYPVLVSVFLDYAQVSFRLDGQPGLLHYLEIEPNVDMEIPIEVPVKTPGWHDLFVVAFRAPDEHPTDLFARFSLGVGGLRTVICAGDCAVPVQRLPQALVGQSADAYDFNTLAFPLLPNDGTPPKQRLLSSAVAKPGQVFAMELWARNPNEESKDYLVLPLLDFLQISMAGSKVLHLRMPPGSELFIPASIRMPNHGGVHELQFVCIFDPYQDLDQVTSGVVESVMRSGLVVEGGQ
jgi:hypothetical protein